MRFRPDQHLRLQGDIRAVREQGRRVDAHAFTLWWRARAERADPARVCIIASIQAVGDAVHRNRARRRLREVYRKHQGLVPAGCDVLLVARASATTWDFDRLEAGFTGACRKISGPAPTAVS